MHCGEGRYLTHSSRLNTHMETKHQAVSPEGGKEGGKSGAAAAERPASARGTVLGALAVVSDCARHPDRVMFPGLAGVEAPRLVLRLEPGNDCDSS